MISDLLIDAVKLRLDILIRDHVAVGKVPEIELHAWLEAPIQRYLVNRKGSLSLIHRRRKMIGRIEMRTWLWVMSSILSIAWASPPGRSSPSQPWEEAFNLGQRHFMVDVRDLGPIARRVGDDIVL